MKVVFVARHNSGGNDDEGAVAFALRKLGHEVICVEEEHGWRALDHLPFELCLSFKWNDVNTLRKLEGKCTRAFYYFDLVSYPDKKLQARCDSRVTWMNRVMPHVEVGFLSDGDWQQQHPEKLVWLTQGFDERQWEYMPINVEKDIDLLFTGISSGGGTEREAWVKEMKKVYGDRFHHVQKGVHGRDMAELVARSKIVLAPSGPVTDRYWSNRVFQVLGYGGCLLHPWSEGLMRQLAGGLLFYTDMNDLHKQIDELLEKDYLREGVAAVGLEQVKKNHTYTHRCEQLIRIVKERQNAQIS